jgi:hypothetical protein
MKIISIFLIYLFLFSCEGTTNKSDQKYSEEQVVESEYIEIEAPPPPKQLEWANGNIYSYDFTETIIKKDSLGSWSARFNFYFWNVFNYF